MKSANGEESSNVKLGPKQFGFVAEHGFANGAHAFHIGPIMIAVRASKPIQDPYSWRDKAPAPHVDEHWKANP